MQGLGVQAFLSPHEVWKICRFWVCRLFCHPARCGRYAGFGCAGFFVTPTRSGKRKYGSQRLHSLLPEAFPSQVVRTVPRLTFLSQLALQKITQHSSREPHESNYSYNSTLKTNHILIHPSSY